MKKTEEQKEFEDWYHNNMPPSRLPNTPQTPWMLRDSLGNYHWAEVSHGFKCWLGGKQSN